MEQLRQIQSIIKTQSEEGYQVNKLNAIDMKWLIEQAEENVKLKGIIAQCRCEECGDELGKATDFSNGILCEYCVQFI